MLSQVYERNQEATVYVGGIDEQVDEEVIGELFTQVGRVRSVHLPRDRVTGKHQSFGFVEFMTETDADYAISVMHMVKLYNRPLRVNKASQDKREMEIGANLFVGNLTQDVDDKLLHETFAAFGHIVSCKVMYDPETGVHRGFGFITYDAFEASDAALLAMNNQFLGGQPINVSYAYKKDTKGERHGSAAERLLAAKRQTFLQGQAERC